MHQRAWGVFERRFRGPGSVATRAESASTSTSTRGKPAVDRGVEERAASPRRRGILKPSRRDFGIWLCLGGAAAVADLPAYADGSSSVREAYFGAGDGRQLAPFFTDLGYRGVKSASVGLADGIIEVVRVRYDESRVKFSDLLRVYFRRVDAADGTGQFKERGDQYVPAIWCGGSDGDYREAVEVLDLLGESGVFGNEPGQALPVRIERRAPESFTPIEAPLPSSDELKKLLRKSGREQKLDAEKGLWGYESYCKDRVCGYYTPAPRCQGKCRKYYPEGGLGLS